MEICVLSGKGGTGKTFVSTNLFNILMNGTYLDCDVEEPNGHIFFDSEVKENVSVGKMIPKINYDKCIKCRKCVDFCRFKSLVMIKDKVLFFDEMCHSCGGCRMICPVDAISEVPRNIGNIERRESRGKNIYTGVLNIGESSGTKIIDKLLSMGENDENIVVDCPPGSDCSVIESIKNADYSIIVAEPTIFGLHNMNMIVNLLKVFYKNFGIIVNKSFGNDEIIEEYAIKNNIEIIEKIPFDKEFGKLNGSGKLITDENNSYKELFMNIYCKVKRRVEK